MIELNPQFLKKKGREEFVILTAEEFRAIRELLEDADDLAALRAARAKDSPRTKGLTLEQVRVRLGLRGRRKAAKQSARRR